MLITRLQDWAQKNRRLLSVIILVGGLVAVAQPLLQLKKHPMRFRLTVPEHVEEVQLSFVHRDDGRLERSMTLRWRRWDDRTRIIKTSLPDGVYHVRLHLYSRSKKTLTTRQVRVPTTTTVDLDLQSPAGTNVPF